MTDNPEIAPQPANPPRMIWVATIDHEHGTNQYADVSEEGIIAQIAEYCTTSWPMDGPPDVFPNGMTDREIVEAYFQYQNEYGEEGLTREEVVLGGA